MAGDVVAVIAHHGTSDSTNVIADQLGQRARLAIYNEGLEMQLERNVRELRQAHVPVRRSDHRSAPSVSSATSTTAPSNGSSPSSTSYAEMNVLPDSDGDVALADALLSACELADRSLAQLRHVAHGVHPHLLTSDGLETALLSLTDTSQQPMSLRVALDG